MRDSNPRMVGPEPTALPLGESPIYFYYTTFPHLLSLYVIAQDLCNKILHKNKVALKLISRN